MPDSLRAGVALLALLVLAVVCADPSFHCYGYSVLRLE